MIDLDEYLEGNKPYQEIIDKVTFDETICVAMGIPIHCNHEEMIVRAIIQRLYEYEQMKEQDYYSEGYNDAVGNCLTVLCDNCCKVDDCPGSCYTYDEMASLKE